MCMQIGAQVQVATKRRNGESWGRMLCPTCQRQREKKGVGRLSRGKMALFIAAASSGRREARGVLDTTAKNGHRSERAEAIPKSE